MGTDLHDQPKNISSILGDYIVSLTQIQKELDNAEQGSIYHLFETSRDYRNSLPAKGSGALQPIYELYCDMVDEAGGIATIATILAMDKISIKNIGIIHNREFEQGVLKIEFYEEDAMKRGTALLKKRNYIVYER